MREREEGLAGVARVNMTGLTGCKCQLTRHYCGTGIENGITLCNDNNDNNCIPRRNLRCFTISSLRRDSSPTCTLKWPERSRVQITRAYLVQHVVLCAMWYEGTAQLLSLTKLKSDVLSQEKSTQVGNVFVGFQL